MVEINCSSCLEEHCETPEIINGLNGVFLSTGRWVDCFFKSEMCDSWKKPMIIVTVVCQAAPDRKKVKGSRMHQQQQVPGGQRIYSEGRSPVHAGNAGRVLIGGISGPWHRWCVCFSWEVLNWQRQRHHWKSLQRTKTRGRCATLHHRCSTTSTTSTTKSARCTGQPTPS